eukprot:1155340-Pelagomonas_calceolata.AAC.2
MQGACKNCLFSGLSCPPLKSYAGIAGNGCADKVAKYQASLKDNNLADAGIPSAGPGGKPSYKNAWLARETEDRVHQNFPPLFPIWCASQTFRMLWNMQYAC